MLMHPCFRFPSPCGSGRQREAKEKKEAQDAEEKAKKEAEEKAKKESEEKIANEVRHKDVGRVVAGSHSGRHAEGRENH